jgi:hypothetical protein
MELEHIDTYKYLGRPVSATNYDQIALSSNLQKGRKTLGWMSTILKREGADPKQWKSSCIEQ